MWELLAGTPHWAWAAFFTAATCLIAPTAYIDTYRTFRWWGREVWMHNAALSPRAYRAQVLADTPKRAPLGQIARAAQAQYRSHPALVKSERELLTDLKYNQALTAARKAITSAEIANTENKAKIEDLSWRYPAVAHPTPGMTYAYIKRIEMS
jgi:hypothetical protein